ncbi:MAG: hypothetical protein JWR69_4754 [Pedosphaera sp.]|nr:hypothetical protein [Pedosphaera sp.]
MKDATNYLTGKLLSLRLLAFALAFPAFVLPCKAQVYNLTDNNSAVKVDVGTQAGMSQWAVDGQNQLHQQWFWFGIGNGPEAAINTISAATVTTPDARTLYTTYANLQLSIEVDYSLTGGFAGSGSSHIGEVIRIQNLSSSSLSLHFFQYSDFDLAGTPGNDTLQLGLNGQGRFYDAFQSEGTLAFHETVVTPGANHGEAALFGQTLGELNDLTQTTLNNSLGPVGPGNATWALQWDLTIAAGGTALISKDKTIEIAPEPSTFVLTGLGLLACVLLKRRQSAY